MLDDDDVDDFWLAMLFSPPGWLGLVLCVLFILVAVQVCSNKDECARKRCDRGKPVLMENDCMCMDRAK